MMLRSTNHSFAALLALCAALAATSCQQDFHFDNVEAMPPDAGARISARAENADPLHCASDSDCVLTSLHCDTAATTCVECIVDEDCAQHSFKRCDAAPQRCVECRVNGDCPTGFGCDSVGHRCMQVCREEPDCSLSAHACDERRQVCVACDDDHECHLDSSAPYCAADGTRCVECRTDSHCAPGRACDPILSICVECRDTRDCAPDAVCVPDSHSCKSL